MTPLRLRRGAALVLVLWLIALLTAVVGAFVLSARVEQLQQRVQDDAGRAAQVASAAVAYSMWRLRSDPLRPPWQPDGACTAGASTTHRWICASRMKPARSR